MSPDILQGFNSGLPDDIYSFGITMWQLKSNVDPYCNTPSNEFVAYHVVKNNLRPDSQLKLFGIDGKENVKTMRFTEFNTNDSVCSNISSYHLNVIEQPSSNVLTPKTPNNKRRPSKAKFLSTGHIHKNLKVNLSLTSTAVKKLDFNLMSNVNRMPFSSRSLNRNQSMVMHKLCESTDDNNNLATLFNDSHQHLSKEKKMKIENSYENIYKQCWNGEAIKRPSSQAILELLNSTFHLFA